MWSLTGLLLPGHIALFPVLLCKQFCCERPFSFFVDVHLCRDMCCKPWAVKCSMDPPSQSLYLTLGLCPKKKKKKRAREFQKNTYYLLYWLCQSLRLCRSQWTVENAEKDGNTRPPDLPLENLYAGQEATVRTGHGRTDWFQIGKGAHQGCILSPCLFNLYAEYIMRSWAGWCTSWNQDCQEKYQ